MIRIPSYYRFKEILEKLDKYCEENGKRRCQNACRVYAGISGRANAVYDMGESPRESSVFILDQFRDMLYHRLFPFYEGKTLSFVPIDQVTWYGIEFYYVDENDFISWLEQTDHWYKLNKHLL